MPTPNNPGRMHGLTLLSGLHLAIKTNRRLHTTEDPHRSSHTILHPPPLTLLPQTPDESSTDTPETTWATWVKNCLTARKDINKQIRDLRRPHTHEARKRKRLSRLLYTSPKRAHAEIFAPHDSPGHNIEAIYNPETKSHLTQPADMAAHTHTHFLKEWTADPSLDATAPYPFNMPQAQDPFTLESHAHHHTQNKYPTLLPTVLQDSTFHRTLRLLANDRAPGPDGIPNALLKILPAPLKTALHNLFKLLWLTGSTPTEWKGSHTIILHKKGDTTCQINALSASTPQFTSCGLALSQLS